MKRGRQTLALVVAAAGGNRTLSQSLQTLGKHEIGCTFAQVDHGLFCKLVADDNHGGKVRPGPKNP